MDLLLDNRSLERSPVVANSAMNRERGCLGPNSYQKELGLNVVEFLAARRQAEEHVAWLDLCCGSGRALIEAAQRLAAADGANLELIGVDLAGMFCAIPPGVTCLRLVETTATAWEPAAAFDLVTCVHGLHYVGDKLRLIQRAVSWLKSDGLLLAHFDPGNVKFSGGEPTGGRILAELRRQGLGFNRRRHLLSCEGRRGLRLDYEYLGADDAAGPNFTGQAAVDSYYRPVNGAAAAA